MKKIIILLLAFFLPLGVVGCKKEEKKQAKKSITMEENLKEDIGKKSAKLYSQALDKASEYNYGDNNQNADKYEYSIVKMDGDEVSQLVIVKLTEYHERWVKIFSYDKKDNKLIEIDEPIQYGASGSLRANLKTKDDGDGLIYWQTVPGNMDTIIEKIKIKDNKLSREKIWEGKFDDSPKDDNAKDINFISIDDRSQIDELAGKKIQKEEVNKKLNSSTQGSEQEDKLDVIIEREKNAGRFVLYGKISIMSPEQLIKYQRIAEQGIPKSNLGIDESEYAIFIPSSSQKISLPTSDGRRNNSAPEIIATSVEDVRAYNGKNVVVSLGPNDGAWPSDTRLPLGQPYAKIKVLGLGTESASKSISKTQQKNSEFEENNIKKREAQEAEYAKGKDFVIHAKNTNMRARPDINSAIIKTLLSGTKIHVIDTSIDHPTRIWYKVTYDGVTGWISNRTINGELN
ncbi:SH3 domain-containing protein [Peptostreptococcus equinus]|uniref:SH3 domain-containing protein n=1 Tax=Peptostreptococcus equinus TaxID=3003601 RepID=A0ABY7JQS7_9FIRM|nr:SH3 domain-containing protein [Peptostreptococcus sp. CBA3647]WAW14403.1 SH3 domain-containing protein [Peptostreptococcus sp. CBA3647]